MLCRVFRNMRFTCAHPGEDEDDVRMGWIVRELGVMIVNPVGEAAHEGERVVFALLLRHDAISGLAVDGL